MKCETTQRKANGFDKLKKMFDESRLAQARTGLIDQQTLATTAYAKTVEPRSVPALVLANLLSSKYFLSLPIPFAFHCVAPCHILT